jgi:hypothetical protein
MSDRLPQPTSVLIKRLRRTARKLRNISDVMAHGGSLAVYRAEANLCDQAAGRLQDFLNGKTDAEIQQAVNEAHR